MRIHAPASRLLPHRTKRSPQHCAVDHATLVDYRFGGVSIEQVDRYYELINFPRRMPADNYAHLAGVLEDEIVMIGLWSSDRIAKRAFETTRQEVTAALTGSGSDTAVDRESHPVQRLLFGEAIDEFRADRAHTDPNCVGYVIDLPATDSRAYDLICDQMNFPGDLPAGLLLHVAGPVGDVWRVTSVWRDAAAIARVFRKAPDTRCRGGRSRAPGFSRNSSTRSAYSPLRGEQAPDRCALAASAATVPRNFFETRKNAVTRR